MKYSVKLFISKIVQRSVVVLALGCGIASAETDEIKFESVGLRVGASLTSRSENFRQYEIATTLKFPWELDLGRDWELGTRLEISAGLLHAYGEDGFVGTAGPLAIFRKKDFPLSFDVGCSPTLLSRDQFGSRDFGMPFQFTSHAGVNCEITSNVRLGYRYSHMSNAHLARPNPGLNLHQIAVTYLF